MPRLKSRRARRPSYRANGKSSKFIVELPVDVSPSNEVRVQTKDAGTLLSALFERCMPWDASSLSIFRQPCSRSFIPLSARAKLVFAEAMGRDVTVPLSFKGFAQAFDAMMTE
jgi:invasion protein IalB